MDSIPTAQELSEKIRDSKPSPRELQTINEVVSRMISSKSLSEYVEDWTPNMINFMKEKGYKFSVMVDTGRHTYCHMYIE
jgi:hypothetical protein